jgi:23S rRNA pseudouridine2605 synthase
MRLNRFLARAGAAQSRRKAEGLIEAGRVRVNGEAVVELATQVEPGVDEVELDGAVVELPDEHAYLMLHKPAGYVTSAADPHADHTVFELVDRARYPALVYVGRLDADTTGLLLFTDDGALVDALAHPRRHVDKVYEAHVKGVPDEAALSRLRAGVQLEDGMTAPAGARLLSRGKSGAVVELRIHEGRNRQVKRMLAAVGHPVESLHRAAFGPLCLGELEPGACRELTSDELAALCACAGIVS